MGKIKSPLSFLYNNQIKAFLFQVITLVAVVYFFYNAADNLLSNIESRGIHTGFDFLGVESGFDIAEHLIDYSSTSSNHLN
jgi:general L-amino acid transport system permease protein